MGMSLILKEFWFLGSLLPSLFFPVGLQRGSITTILGLFVRPSRGKTVTRWELLEINNGCNEVRRVELNSVQTKPQEVRGWEEETKIQAMSEGVVRSLGTGRFLDWGALDASGSAGGILICWDKRTLDVLELEIVDELELLDLPNVRGVAYLEWGRNNRLWARLDRFLVTQNWLDQFSGGIVQALAKVLANRLKKVLGRVVFVDQNTFVTGKQILDASLIANKVLHKMDFGSRWMDWIWRCISTAKFSVLVNGVPAGFFSSTKGLCQGDPLSPYLLSWEWNKERESNLLSWILAWFEATSDLRINLAKSELILVGEVEEIEEMAVELGCRVGSLPNVYLGLPLGAQHKAPSMWDGVEERMRRRLALGSLERKVHLIKWEVVCAQKEKGGLGIRKIVLLNKALLGKWIWRFAFEKDNLWKKVILVKYGQEGFGWRTNEARWTFGVGIWKEILKEANWCWDNIEFKVGLGCCVYALLIYQAYPMTSKTLRRRLHHGDVDGKRHEHLETSGLDGLNEPLLGNYEYDDKDSEGPVLKDLWDDERRKEHQHWTILFSHLIAEWAQWLANIVIGSGTLLKRLLPFDSTTQNGQSKKILPPSLSPLQEMGVLRWWLGVPMLLPYEKWWFQLVRSLSTRTSIVALGKRSLVVIFPYGLCLPTSIFNEGRRWYME
ncbi:hypothetical protein CK203_060238 [Vitis vinifera]|uniref:Uncharacterized protein n=1 Tax=Vitis vinifera TaxID=29760 RepID=A0A438FS29_VITVI|nr:hypothetical protein CK203_060238 [Vitis vinifera]